MLKDDELVDRIAADYRKAGLDDRRLAMLRYADKLTRQPSAMKKTDVEDLRAVGFDDLDILNLAEVTAYYAYVNRIAVGLGVELESWGDGG